VLPGSHIEWGSGEGITDASRTPAFCRETASDKKRNVFLEYTNHFLSMSIMTKSQKTHFGLPLDVFFYASCILCEIGRLKTMPMSKDVLKSMRAYQHSFILLYTFEMWYSLFIIPL
jgi:hypothetical protein